MKIKSIVGRMLSMCPEAWYIFIRTIQLSCFLLLCAFLLLLEWNGCMYENRSLYMTAVSLQETVQALLILAAIIPVCIEDIYS